MKTAVYFMVAIMAGTCLLVFIVALTLGYFPGLSNVIGLGGSKDLGITYEEADYLQAREKIDQALDSQKLQTTFTSTELTALMNECTESACVFDDAQVKTEADGTLKIAGVVDRREAADLLFAYTDDGTNVATLNTLFQYLPSKPAFYIETKVVGENDEVIFDLQQVTLGGLWISDLESVEDEMNRTVHEYLAALPDTQVTALQVTDVGITMDINLTHLEEEALH